MVVAAPNIAKPAENRLTLAVGEIAAVAAVPIVFASELADFVPLVEVSRTVKLIGQPREVGLAPEPREVLLVGGVRDAFLTSR